MHTFLSIFKLLVSFAAGSAFLFQDLIESEMSRNIVIFCGVVYLFWQVFCLGVLSLACLGLQVSENSEENLKKLQKGLKHQRFWMFFGVLEDTLWVVAFAANAWWINAFFAMVLATFVNFLLVLFKQMVSEKSVEE